MFPRIIASSIESAEAAPIIMTKSKELGIPEDNTNSIADTPIAAETMPRNKKLITKRFVILRFTNHFFSNHFKPFIHSTSFVNST